jgi:ElaB/YqjD/DUF883 family membrane-anchored ribosome-binding protein
VASAPDFGSTEDSREARILDYPTAASTNEAVKTLISSVETLLAQVHAAPDSQLARELHQTTSALLAARAALEELNPQVREERTGSRTATDGSAFWDARTRERRAAGLGLTAFFVLSLGFWVGRSATDRRLALLPHLGRHF